MISIHALRVEGDKLFLRRYSRGAHFYPRPPGGGRPHHISYRVSNAFNFYPRPPGGGRLRFVCNVDFFSTISIHALRVEGDTPSLVSIKIFKGFLSTPSGWRATKTCHICIRIDQISIHALRVEGDTITGFPSRCLSNFYPRPPGGGRRSDVVYRCNQCGISIHALRVEGDAHHGRNTARKRRISIHALRVEGDSKNGQSFRLFLRKREKNLPL